MSQISDHESDEDMVCIDEDVTTPNDSILKVKPAHFLGEAPSLLSMLPFIRESTQSNLPPQISINSIKINLNSK